MNQHALGWIKDTPDFRDHVVGEHLLLNAPHILPRAVDLVGGLPPCYDQLALGSCTGNAIAAALQFDRRKQGLPDWTPSRLFIYFNERVMEGTRFSDAGAQIRDGIKSVAKQGAPPEALWPYDLKMWAIAPPVPVVAEAAKHPGLEYASVTPDLYDLRAALAAGYPVVCGISVYESFESDAVAATGTVPMPSRTEAFLGGHAVVLKGYDDGAQQFGVRNSWGPSWGANGYFTLPYDYLINPRLAGDFWVVRHTL